MNMTTEVPMVKYNTLPTTYQQYIHLSRYARWLPEESRRETWEETVTRYFDFFDTHLKEHSKGKLTKEERNDRRREDRRKRRLRGRQEAREEREAAR